MSSKTFKLESSTGIVYRAIFVGLLAVPLVLITIPVLPLYLFRWTALLTPLVGAEVVIRFCVSYLWCTVFLCWDNGDGNRQSQQLAYSPLSWGVLSALVSLIGMSAWYFVARLLSAL